MSRPVFTNVKLDALVSLPFSIRSEESDEDLAGLVESILEVGMVEQIIIRPSKDRFKFEIVAGERRVQAARKAGLKEVPASVQTLSDEQAYLIQLTENAQRKDLSDLDKAHALDRYMKTFKYTQEVLAKKMGKKQEWISHHLGMLKLEEINIMPRGIIGTLTEKQAREILAASPEKQSEILDEITKTGEVPSSRELHAVAHPAVKCDHCGEPVEKPVHLGGKFYHDECAEQVKAEAEPSLVPGEATPSFDVSDKDVETVETPSKKAIEKGPIKPEPLLTGYSWTCPDCGAKFIINHVDWPGSKSVEHRLEACAS